jgi:S-adenosylmethionine:diacylglycerol 3-amino-3-carboxypropyl transferase
MDIPFTRAWEDDRLDAELLRVAPGERLLVVAGGGDAALALAADGACVTAVDRSRAQLDLVALKLAAARTLPADTVYRWFEVGRDPMALRLYRTQVRAALADPDAEVWDREIGRVVGGLHDHGGVGQPFHRLGQLARITCPGIARVIETTPDPAAQAAWWRRHVRPVLFSPLTHLAAARTPILAPLAPHPTELERMRRSGWSRGLADRVEAIVDRMLVRHHPWWRPAFAGRPADPGSGAAWLDESRLRALASMDAGRLRLIEGDLAAVLRAQGAGTLAAISVSNVPDWLDPAAGAELAAAVRHALAPGGRALVRRVVGPAVDAFADVGLVRDPISDGLVTRDRTALYERVDLYRQYSA